MVQSDFGERDCDPRLGGKDLKQGTIRGILRQLGINSDDFEKI
jgi:predicted RNA binding protein YcfA (HicA-like mRNA interferase family)